MDDQAKSLANSRADRSPRRKLARILGIVLILTATEEVIRRALPPIRREIDYRLALEELGEGRLDQAEIRLDGLVSEHPTETRARLPLVRIYRLQGRITEAEEALQRAVELGLPIEDARPERDLLRAITSQGSPSVDVR